MNPYLIPENAASEARNVRSNDEYGSLSKRTATMSYGTLGLFKVTSIHRFYKSDDTAYLIGTGATYILKGDDSGGVATILRDQLTSGLRWTWVTYKDKAIGCNGTDRCQKWDGAMTTTDNTDGARTASILTSDHGAPFAELNTGANLDASAWYQYKMKFTNGTTTWYSNAVSNPILTGADVRDIKLTDIPLGPSGTTSRMIYRTEGTSTRAGLDAATFKLVASISDNATTTYDDAVADGSLTTEWSTTGNTGLTPPIAKFITLHNNRLFLANAPNYNSYIYWSYAFYDQIFNPADYDYVRIDDGDAITGQFEFLGKMVYFKTNSITNFETQSSDDTKWRMYTHSFVGCPAPYSIAHSPSGIFYLGWDGLYVYNGERSQLVSDSVTDVIRDISSSSRNDVAGVFYNNEYRLAYTSEKSGASENNTVLMLDVTRNSYVIDDQKINCWEVFDSGNDFGTLYSGSSDIDGNILSYNPSSSVMVLRYKSDFTKGTKDSIAYGGTENNPDLSIGWGIYINDSSMAGVSLDSVTYDSATINRPDTTGYWWSPAIEVNASNYDKLYWNEDLGCCGDVTFVLRSGVTADAATLDSLAWSSSVTDPSGSDLSSLTANNFLQLRATLTTNDITETPFLESLNNYVIKLVYSKVGSTNEIAINSIWRSGFSDFGSPTIPKRIWGIDIYYAGTSGIMTFGLKNERGDIDQSFSFDLSVDPNDNDDDQYFGNSTEKIYKWLSPINSETNPMPIGRKWQFSIHESGATVWNVSRLDIRFENSEYYDD